MPEDETSSEAPVKCPRCDHMTDRMAGHIVQDGRVTKCPFINVDVVIQSPARKDKIV